MQTCCAFSVKWQFSVINFVSLNHHRALFKGTSKAPCVEPLLTESHALVALFLTPPPDAQLRMWTRSWLFLHTTKTILNFLSISETQAVVLCFVLFEREDVTKKSACFLQKVLSRVLNRAKKSSSMKSFLSDVNSLN